MMLNDILKAVILLLINGPYNTPILTTTLYTKVKKSYFEP